MLQDFVEHQMKPGELVLILSTGGGSGILQQFTADRRLLSQSINRSRPIYFSNALRVNYFTLENAGAHLSMTQRKVQAVRGCARNAPGTREVNARGDIDPLETSDVRETLEQVERCDQSH